MKSRRESTESATSGRGNTWRSSATTNISPQNVKDRPRQRPKRLHSQWSRRSPAAVLPSGLLPGTHRGAFLPTFSAGQTVTWTVGGTTVTANAASTLLTCAPPAVGSNGLVATVQTPEGPTTVTLRRVPAELESAIVRPDLFTPGLTVGSLDGQLDVSNNGSATLYHVPIVPGAPLVQIWHSTTKQPQRRVIHRRRFPSHWLRRDNSLPSSLCAGSATPSGDRDQLHRDGPPLPRRTHSDPDEWNTLDEPCRVSPRQRSLSRG